MCLFGALFVSLMSCARGGSRKVVWLRPFSSRACGDHCDFVERDAACGHGVVNIAAGVKETSDR